MLRSIKLFQEIGKDVIERYKLNFSQVPYDILDFKKLVYLDMGDIDRVHLITGHSSVCWYKYHMPIFRPSSDLFSMLALTDILSIKINEIKLPFDTLAIEVPLQWFLKDDENDSSSKIETILLHKYSLNDIEYLCIRICSYNDMIHYESDINDNHTIQEWSGRKDLSSPLFENLPECVNAIFGLILYIAEQGKGRKFISHSRKRKSKRISINNPKPEVWILGENIKVDPEIIDAATSAVSNRALWTVKKRHVVRGHWRNQACGEKRQNHKRIWIKPHWKGPKDGERLTHIYEVGKKNKDENNEHP